MSILEKFDAEAERRKKLMPVLEESVRKLASKYKMKKSTIAGAYFAENDRCWIKLQACWNQKSFIKITCTKYFDSPMGENSFGYYQIFDNQEAAEPYLEIEINKLKRKEE